jgi:hypothetical protein
MENGLNWLDVVFVASFTVCLGHRAGGVRVLNLTVQLFPLMVRLGTCKTVESPDVKTNHHLTQTYFDLRYIGNVVSNFNMKC